jgi:hypothetical protein
MKPGAAVVTFDAKVPVQEAGMRRIMDRYQHRFRLLSPLAFEIRFLHADWPAVAPELTTALQMLA